MVDADPPLLQIEPFAARVRRRRPGSGSHVDARRPAAERSRSRRSRGEPLLVADLSTARWSPTSTGARRAPPGWSGGTLHGDVADLSRLREPASTLRHAGRAVADDGRPLVPVPLLPEARVAGVACRTGGVGMSPASVASAGSRSRRRRSRPRRRRRRPRSAASSARSASASGTGTSPTSHDHRLLCVCRPCYLLFAPRGRRRRPLPRRRRGRCAGSTTWSSTRRDWDALRIPVDLAFFFRQQPTRTALLAFYPGPGGATESDARPARLGRHRSTPTRCSTDDRCPTSRRCCCAATTARSPAHLVPIDVCYELVGVVREPVDGARRRRRGLAADRRRSSTALDASRPDAPAGRRHEHATS